MRKLNFLRKHKLVSSILLGIFLAFIPAVIVMAGWGPSSRPTFTWAKPATYVTFNSMTDNPQYGDERPFYDGRKVGGPSALDKIHVNDKDEIDLRVFFHNNAAENLDKTAKNTRVKILLPHSPKTSTFSTAIISADNAKPAQVWDTVDFTGDQAFSLEYVPGSAKLWNNVFRGAQLSDSIVSDSGALVGFDKIDGKVPGCERFSGYVTIKVKVKMQPTVTPAFACTLLTLNVQPNRKVDATVTYSVTGGTFKNATFNWGDNSTPTVTTNTTASHTYAQDGNYTVSATLKFDIGGTEQQHSCSKPLTFTTPPVTPPVTPTPPTVLPDTGPGTIAAIFAGVSTFTGAFHYFWRRQNHIDL